MTHKTSYAPAFAGSILQMPSIVKSGWLHAETYSGLPKHYHPSIEVILITKGSAHIEIDGKHLYARENDLLIYPARHTHFDEFFSNSGSGVENYFIRISGLQLRGLPGDCILPPGTSPVVPTGPFSDELLKLFQLIYRECTLRQPGCSTIVNRAVLSVLLIILRISERERLEEMDEARIFCCQALEYIRQNFRNNNIKVSDIAKALAVSHSHLTHVFSRELHLSPIKYINFLRISEAKQMLLFTKQDVHRISKAVGYGRYAVFLNHFRNQTGMSPEEYRGRYNLSSEEDYGDHIELA